MDSTCVCEFIMAKPFRLSIKKKNMDSERKKNCYYLFFL